MSPCPPPSPETLKPSLSQAFPAGEGWVWCPEPFPIEGVDARWYWNAEKRCFGLTAFTHRAFPRIGQVEVNVEPLPADSLDPDEATWRLEQELHELVTLAAME